MDIVEELISRKAALKAILAKNKHQDDEEENQPLSPAGRLFHEPHFNCHIIAIMGCKTKIDHHVVKAGLEKTLIKHPRFSSILVHDERDKNSQMRWVPTVVKLDDHIYVPDLDPNMESPDKFLEDYISDLTITKINMSKPLWDLHLLNVKVENAEAVGIIRIHHSLGDGASLLSIILAMIRKTSDPDALPSVPTKKVKKTKSPNRMWLLLKVAWMIIRLMWNTFADIYSAMCTLVFLKDTKTPLKGGPGVEFTPKRIVYRTVSLNDIKLVKNAMNMTINDVVLGVTAAGLSHYLNRRYGEQEKDKGTAKKRNNLPKNTCLRAALFVNIRPSAGIQAMADIMENDKAGPYMGNWLGFVLLPFNIALRDDPLDYVRKAKATVDRKKLSLEAIFTFASAALVVKSIGIKAASALADRILTQTTMSFSNVVGPLEETSFYGHTMTYLAPSVYGHPHGLTIHFTSYMDKMTIVVSADEKCVPNPHQLCDDLEESLKLIKDAIIARRG